MSPLSVADNVTRCTLGQPTEFGSPKKPGPSGCGIDTYQPGSIAVQPNACDTRCERSKLPIDRRPTHRPIDLFQGTNWIAQRYRGGAATRKPVRCRLRAEQSCSSDRLCQAIDGAARGA